MTIKNWALLLYHIIYIKEDLNSEEDQDCWAVPRQKDTGWSDHLKIDFFGPKHVS